MIAGGSSNREIAEELFIAHSTVRWYIRQIYNKLGAEDRDHAIVIAEQLGLHMQDESSDEDTLTRTIKNLPTQLNDFVGREQELRELFAYAHNPAVYRCETYAAVTLRPSVFHSLDAPRLRVSEDHEALTLPVWCVSQYTSIHDRYSTAQPGCWGRVWHIGSARPSVGDRRGTVAPGELTTRPFELTRPG